MDDALQRLLETERRAEDIARQAGEDKERAIADALAEARRLEQQFQERIPELHAGFLEKARARAEQTVTELRKHYDERHARLREQAEARETQAVEAALALLSDPER